jgi:hypothetical protein
MVNLRLEADPDEVIASCERRGLAVRGESFLKSRGGGKHWHVGLPGRSGTIEITRAADGAELKVA